MSYFRTNSTNKSDKKASSIVRIFLKNYIHQSLYKYNKKMISFKGKAIKKISNLEKGGKKVGLTTANKWFNKYINKFAYSIFNADDEIIFNRTEMNKIKKLIINA
jgi:hypothetical protein